MRLKRTLDISQIPSFQIRNLYCFLNDFVFIYSYDTAICCLKIITTKENMEGRVTRGNKKERSNMERGGKDSIG